MEQYASILIIAIPIFCILILIEKLYGILILKDETPFIDMISSLYSGMTNIIKDLLKISFTLWSYGFLLSKLSIFKVENNVTVYIIAFIVIDFQGYWVHRWSHKINIFWNKHVIHHSSEEFNLACALRQSISSFINLFTFLLIPAAIVGVPEQVIDTIVPIHLFLQFWYHTKHIRKLGFLEYIIVTPSHHRVHHSINPVYIDKNYGQIFIFWDKIFGTFQKELDDEPAVYGITKPVQTFNPFVINFQHLWLLIKDAYRAEQWKDRLMIWFKPTGWRPEGFDQKYPVYKIEDVHLLNKYKREFSYRQNILIMTQFIGIFFLLFHLLFHLKSMNLTNIYGYSLFIAISIFSASEHLNKNKYSFYFELMRMLYGLSVLFLTQSWFNTFFLQTLSSYCIIGTLGLTFLASIALFSEPKQLETIRQ